VVAAVALLLVNALPFLPDEAWVALLWPLFVAVSGFRKPEAPPKKPLEMTGRAKRMLWTARGLVAAAGAALLLLMWSPLDAAAAGRQLFVYPALLAALVLVHAAPWVMLVANVFCARCRWRSTGVCGSGQRAGEVMVTGGGSGKHGKTSTKYFIEALLGASFGAEDAGSFNTPGDTRGQRDTGRRPQSPDREWVPTNAAR
jgi:hypothetical protein